MLKRNLGIKHYQSLFNDDVLEAPLPAVSQHGRNPELISKRDSFLLYRVYYKNKMLRMPYPDALKELSLEVYLSEMMIQKILAAKADDMLSIKKAAPSLRDLKDKYPHIVW